MCSYRVLEYKRHRWEINNLEGGRFKTDEALENLIRVNGNIEYRLGENTRIRLISMLKYALGQGTHYDGIKKVFGNTAPLLYPNPTKYSSSNVTNLMDKIKKGMILILKLVRMRLRSVPGSVLGYQKTLVSLMLPRTGVSLLLLRYYGQP